MLFMMKVTSWYAVCELQVYNCDLLCGVDMGLAHTDVTYI